MLFTAFERSDSVHTPGFRWPKVHGSAGDTCPNTRHRCLPPLKPFDSHLEIKEEALKMCCAWPPFAWCFWLTGTRLAVEAISNNSFCSDKRSSREGGFISEQHLGSTAVNQTILTPVSEVQLCFVSWRLVFVIVHFARLARVARLMGKAAGAWKRVLPCFILHLSL